MKNLILATLILGGFFAIAQDKPKSKLILTGGVALPFGSLSETSAPAFAFFAQTEDLGGFANIGATGGIDYMRQIGSWYGFMGSLNAHMHTVKTEDFWNSYYAGEDFETNKATVHQSNSLLAGGYVGKSFGGLDLSAFAQLGGSLNNFPNLDLQGDNEQIVVDQVSYFAFEYGLGLLAEYSLTEKWGLVFKSAFYSSTDSFGVNFSNQINTTNLEGTIEALNFSQNRVTLGLGASYKF